MPLQSAGLSGDSDMQWLLIQPVAMTPNNIVFGRETRMPVDIVDGIRHDDEETTYDGYVSLMKERLLDAYADVRV